ncbi:CD177 antigen-like [Grammomys surdaster]|uniref:CD177 antigen-like n=1 Tax=Grammomys surdaster TaxID=491861 RepID=UPI00109F60C8|nr:CD177 antigen-like [Grammomys surdaster]
MFRLGNGFAEEAVEWTALGSQVCEPDEICQETLLLIDVGVKSLILASKGLSKAASNTTLDVQEFSKKPGIVAASYVHFCDTELCNNASSTRVLLDKLSLTNSSQLNIHQCPVCLRFHGSCSQESKFTICPKSTRCYYSDITVEGGQS